MNRIAESSWGRLRRLPGDTWGRHQTLTLIQGVTGEQRRATELLNKNEQKQGADQVSSRLRLFVNPLIFYSGLFWLITTPLTLFLRKRTYWCQKPRYFWSFLFWFFGWLALVQCVYSYLQVVTTNSELIIYQSERAYRSFLPMEWFHWMATIFEAIFVLLQFLQCVKCYYVSNSQSCWSNNLHWASTVGQLLHAKHLATCWWCKNASRIRSL